MRPIHRLRTDREWFSVELLVLGALTAGVVLTIVVHSVAILFTVETVVHRTIQLSWFAVLAVFIATYFLARPRPASDLEQNER